MDNVAFHSQVCRSKKAYRSRRIAKARAQSLRLTHALGLGAVPRQKPYRCPICTLWHLRTRKVICEEELATEC